MAGSKMIESFIVGSPMAGLRVGGFPLSFFTVQM